jgi:hypothetical protein
VQDLQFHVIYVEGRRHKLPDTLFRREYDSVISPELNDAISYGTILDSHKLDDMTVHSLERDTQAHCDKLSITESDIPVKDNTIRTRKQTWCANTKFKRLFHTVT